MAVTEIFEIPLSEESYAALMKPVNGDGGFQEFFRRIKDRVKGEGRGAYLELIGRDEYDALLRVCEANKGRGGFQDRARNILWDVICEELRVEKRAGRAAAGETSPPPAPTKPKPPGKVLFFTPQPALPFGGEE